MKDPTFVLETHESFKTKTHIYDIKKTGQKGIFAVGTYKGLYILNIDSQTLKITMLNKFFNEPGIKNEIRSLSYVNKNYLLLAFQKDTQLYLFDYVKNKVNYHFETPQMDPYQQAIVSLQEVLRQGPNKAVKVYETAVPSNVYIIQGTKGIQLIDIENSYYPVLVPVKDCFFGIHIEKSEEDCLTIYSNAREGLKRRFIKVTVPY